MIEIALLHASSFILSQAQTRPVLVWGGLSSHCQYFDAFGRAAWNRVLHPGEGWGARLIIIFNNNHFLNYF